MCSSDLSHEARAKAQALYRNTSVAAHCGSGEKLVAGGYQFTNLSHQQDAALFSDYAAGGAWKLVAVSYTVPAKVKAFAYCERGVVIKVSSARSGSIGYDSVGSVTASCRPDETLLGGGYTQKPTPDFYGNDGPAFFIGASHRSGKRSWIVTGENFSSVSGKLIAYAYCES